MGKKLLLLMSVLGVMAAVYPAQTLANERAAKKPNIFNSSGLPIPRFISLRSDKVFVRTGPALRYPIKWVFQRKGMPIEVVQEFDTWRKIRDFEGQEGWVHQTLTQGRRYGLVTSNNQRAAQVPIYKNSQPDARMVALIEPNVIVRLEECAVTHCKVSSQGFEGWMERKFLYGIYEDEKFD